MTNISVFDEPESELARRWVSFELRNGLCFAREASAQMTSPSAESPAPACSAAQK